MSEENSPKTGNRLPVICS